MVPVHSGSRVSDFKYNFTYMQSNTCILDYTLSHVNLKTFVVLEKGHLVYPYIHVGFITIKRPPITIVGMGYYCKH